MPGVRVFVPGTRFERLRIVYGSFIWFFFTDKDKGLDKGTMLFCLLLKIGFERKKVSFFSKMSQTNFVLSRSSTSRTCDKCFSSNVDMKTQVGGAGWGWVGYCIVDNFMVVLNLTTWPRLEKKVELISTYDFSIMFGHTKTKVVFPQNAFLMLQCICLKIEKIFWGVTKLPGSKAQNFSIFRDFCFKIMRYYLMSCFMRHYNAILT